MNKKVFLLALIFISSILWLFVSVSYAQGYTEADMKAVTVRFCEAWSWASTHDGVFYVEPGKETTVRLCVVNGWDKQVWFEYWFSVSWIWNGRYCQGDIGAENNFSILIPWTKERKIMINPKSSQVIEEQIVIPPGMSGLQLGCLGYNLVQPENTLVGWMFSLQVRKVGYMDIMVWWESDIKSSIKVLNITWGIFSTNKKVKAEVDDKNNLKLSFLVANEWNIRQIITITGTITNLLGFQQNFSVDANNMAPGSKNTFTVDVGILPVYKWLFAVDFTIQSEPQFMFPIANEELKKPWYISDTSKIFLFSWIQVIAFVVILLVLYKLFVPRRARVKNA